MVARLPFPFLALYPPERAWRLKGNGGADIQKHVTHYRFVMRTDIKSYYASIDHYILLEQLSLKIKDKFVLNLLWQYMHRTVHYGGLYRDITRGISRGCPLSPVIGAYYLNVLDDRLSSTGAYYVRYMDDVLIMVESRWRLRRAVKILNSCLVELKLEKHPDKTFVERLDKGFDFLGYHFSTAELSLADQTIQHFREHLHRLYEQQRAAPNRAAMLGAYVIRWLRWTQAGLGNLYRASNTAQLATMVGYGWMVPIRSTL